MDVRGTGDGLRRTAVSMTFFEFLKVPSKFKLDVNFPDRTADLTGSVPVRGIKGRKEYRRANFYLIASVDSL